MTESVLVVYGPTNTGKIRRHVGPLALAADVTLVCIDAGERVEGVAYRTAPSIGVRPIGLLAMFLLAFAEGFRGEYDAVASFSLIPHGCFALVVGRSFGLPTHLGILGVDLDEHAHAAYGPAIAALIRRFDVVSVPGTYHARQLERMGVERIETLTHPVDGDRFGPPDGADARYDYVWVGRFGAEKRPLRFVRALARLAAEGAEFRAVMLGDGPLRDDVARALSRLGLADRVDLPGWVDDPAEYYRASRTFVLTSEREALPFTLLEAMATGLACVVPAVGDIPDVAEDGRNALVLGEPSAGAFADALMRLRADPDLRRRLGSEATRITEECSYEAAAADWEAILRSMGVRDDERTSALGPRAVETEG